MPPYRQAYVEITSVCNFQCGFCPSPTLQRPRAFMSPELFERMVPELKQLCGQVYLHVLGEPLLHPQLPVFLDMLGAAELPAAITTNGSMLYKYVDYLMGCKGLQQINFSLHALREPNLPCDGEAVLESVIQFCVRAARERPKLWVNLRFWNLDSREAEADPWSVQVRERLVKAFGVEWVPPIPGRRHRRLSENVSVHQDQRFVWPGEAMRKQVHAPRDRGFCQALHTHFAVLVDGRVVPCCLDAEGQLELGRVQAHTLQHILQDTRAQRMRTGFGEGKLVEALCKSCDFCRRFKKSS